MYSWDNAQVVLVGNKTDLEEERVISTERGRRLAEQLGRLQWYLSYIFLYIYFSMYILFVRVVVVRPYLCIVKFF